MVRRRASDVWRPAILAALLVIGCAPAIQPLGPARPLALREGEGLLVLHVDSDIPIAALELNRGTGAHAIQAGHHVWLVRAREGDYRWVMLRLGHEAGREDHIEIEKEDEFAFEVKSGAINYPGALIVRSHRASRSVTGYVRIRNRNHAAMAIRMLRQDDASILDAYPLRYAGPTPDGFLEHYTEAREATPESAP